jgi:hypothetical protein
MFPQPRKAGRDGGEWMKALKFTKTRREAFLTALADTGIVSAAATVAGITRARAYQVRKQDPDFASAWEEAEEQAADALEVEAWRRAVDGVPEPMVSAGRVVRDDDGQPLAIRRYSDNLLLALLKARRPERFSLVEQVAAYALDPLGFVFFAFPWGEAGTELVEAAGPREWQHSLLDELGRRLREGAEIGHLLPILMARASGHGVGKSTVAAWVILWGLSTMPNARVVVTANTDSQLRTKTWPEVTKWLRLMINRDWFKATATAVFSAQAKRERLWRADAIAWSEENTEAFAGLHNKGRRVILIFDEASAISDKIWEVSEGALTDEDTEIIWLAFGNPTRNSGRFRECFGRFRHRWGHGHIDSRSVEGTNKAQLEQWVRDYGEHSDFVRVRVRGVFPHAGSMQFISSELVEAAAASDRDVPWIRDEPLIMGVDVARFGDDASIIRFRQGRNARGIPPIKLRGADTMELAARIADESNLHRADAIFIDGGGVAAGWSTAAGRPGSA